MNLIDPISMEFTREAATTRKLLERVPQDQLAWKPHEKSMSMGRLATHIAEMAMWVVPTLKQDELVLDPGHQPQTAASVSELLSMFDKNVADATEAMKGETNEHLMQTWRLKMGDQVFLEMPRIAVLRSVILSHVIHHRGQLSVYLRLHNVPVPSIYGPSADEPM